MPADALDMALVHRVFRNEVRNAASLVRGVNAGDTTRSKRVAEQLAAAVEDLSARVDEHLADEERNVVPLITEHISAHEWREATDRGAEFMSMRNLRLGLVLAGYVKDAASPDERRRFMANVPFAKRVVAQLFGARTLDAYRAKLTAT